MSKTITHIGRIQIRRGLNMMMHVWITTLYIIGNYFVLVIRLFIKPCFLYKPYRKHGYSFLQLL